MRDDGVMECWSNGVLNQERPAHHTNTPALHLCPMKKARLQKPRHEFGLRKLARRSRDFRHDVHAFAIPVEINLPVLQREERPIASRADVLARDEFRPALPHDDAAGADLLAAIRLHAEPFADAVAPVADAALTFLM